ncbi:MAG: cytochrome [Acidobacteria bacterium]|nr:cytochrome [Acidobacteriota bacterium]
MTRARAVTLALLFAAHALTAATLTPQQLRGRAIYRTGESQSGTPIVALVGTEDVEVGATAMPCASCHGRDGKGRAEGGVTPTNLQWDALAKPYEVATAGGRTHPPYTLPMLKRAITMGSDPAKNRLLPAMPRYRMSMSDLDDLVAYLPLLGSDRDPGTSDDAIVVGVIVPPGDSGVREVVSAYYASINAKGGIFGRRIEPRFTFDEEPFAIAPSFGTADAHIPTITALGTGGFQILAGLEEQCRALIASTEGKVRVAGKAPPDLGDRITTDPHAPNILVLMTPLPLTTNTLLVPAAYYVPPPPHGANVFVAVPWSSADVTVAGRAELPAPTPVRATALAAAKLFVRALERTGRDLDRESLTKMLESFYQEPTEVTRPVTWTPKNHVGSSEVSVVRVSGR